MRIVIDLQGAQTESRYRGIGRYSLSIAQAIARNAGAAHEVWIVLNGAFPDSLAELTAVFAGLVPPERICVFEAVLPVAEHDPANSTRARVAEQLRAAFLQQLRPDVVLVTSLFEGFVDDAITSVAPASGIETAVILYDLIPHAHPQVYLPTPVHRAFYQRKIDALQHAGLLLAISAHSREEAIDALGIDPQRVVNISTAVDARFVPHDWRADQSAPLLARLGVVRKMLLYAPGGFDSRKNFDGLIAAYASLAPALRAEYQLVIASRVNPGDRDILRNLARAAGLQADELVLTGYLQDDDLVMLYGLAELFVFPSKHEGFGLPVLEAMACGAPTIGSNTTSVPEVIGNPAALFDPASVPSMAAKLTEVMQDAGLRAELRAHGLRHAKTFSWDRCAETALAALAARFGARTHAATPDWAELRQGAQASYQGLVGAVARTLHGTPGAAAQLPALARAIARNQDSTDQLLRRRELPARLTWRVEGPFDSTYSLALLNRETAIALDALGHDVVLHSTEGPGDFAPKPAFLQAHPHLAQWHGRAAAISQDLADVASRNLYPPRVNDMQARINMLHHYAWEESGYPSDWTDAFNLSLQGMTCLSEHVRKVMVDNGVAVPMRTSGCGVDHWERIEADPAYTVTGRAFRFLHVSSCFPRKGADVLLKAYGEAFSIDDDVTLIIKTFANPHNEVHVWLANARRANPRYPDIQIIEEDLGDGQLKALFGQCHALVAPSRAEGFGLPLAEAMLSGLPVITTGWSGQRDFCTLETAWLVDFDFAPAQTHFDLFSSVWAEPRQEHLAAVMREVHGLPLAARQARTAAGRALLMTHFKWTDVAARLVDGARACARMPATPRPAIGWITTWNAKCGIATYSAHLVNMLPAGVTVLAAHNDARTAADSAAVRRTWNAGDGDTLGELEAAIDAAGLDTLVIQFNYGFFDFPHFAAFLVRQHQRGRKLVLMLHATIDPVHAPTRRLAMLADAFRLCDRILVHAPGDLNRLKQLGLVDNVALFPHGVVDYALAAAPSNARFTVSSYGFFLDHKGLPELIEAIALLVKQGRNVALRMVNAAYPIDESARLVERARARVAALGLQDRIEIIADFLEDEQSLALLGQADLLIFPYQGTGESSSAAVRYGLATGRPVAVTPLPIFDDVSRAVFKLPGKAPAALASGIAAIMDDMAKGHASIAATRQRADAWRDAHRYSRLGQRLHNILVALHRDSAPFP